jgi:hypothetical protein
VLRQSEAQKKKCRGNFFYGSAKVAVAVAGHARYRAYRAGYHFIAKSTFETTSTATGWLSSTELIRARPTLLEQKHSNSWNYITKYSLDVIELTIDLLAALHPHPSTSL